MTSEDEITTNREGSLKGFWLGMLFGFLSGFGTGMLYNPPFEGILKSSADVQGLTFFSWIAFAFIGGIAGCFIGAFSHGLLLRRKWQQNRQNG